MQFRVLLIVCLIVHGLSLTEGSPNEGVNRSETETVNPGDGLLENRTLAAEVIKQETDCQTMNKIIRNSSLPKDFLSCTNHSECEIKLHKWSECNFGYCSCLTKYDKGYPKPLQESGVFKAAMISVACFIGAVISAILVFFYNRRRICRSLRDPSEYDSEIASRRGSDVFSVSDRLARQRLADKPPSYREVLRRDRMHRGVPPPAYSDENTGSTSNEPSSCHESRERSDSDHILILRLASELHRRALIGEQNSGATSSETAPEEPRNDLNTAGYVNHAFVTHL